MRLSLEQVIQPVTRHYSQRFLKEVWRIDTPEPVVVVRKRLPGKPALAPVLLIHGFGQNRNCWHLPQRSFVNHLADAGFDVFNVDLRGHGRSAELGGKRARGVDDYIREDLPAVLDHIVRVSGFSRTFVVGHSLGGICAAAIGARHPELVCGVAALGPPHALGRGHFLLGNLLKALGHSVGRSGMLRGSQVRLPIDLLGKAVHSSRMLWDSKYAPIPVHAWKPGSFSRGELSSYIERSFDGASLGTADDLISLAYRGEIRSQIDGVSYTRQIEESQQPLLVVCGKSDLLANPGAVKPAFERSASADKKYVKVPAGHGDLLVGRQAPISTWPIVTSWLRERVPAIAENDYRRPHDLTQSGEYSLEEAS